MGFPGTPHAPIAVYRTAGGAVTDTTDHRIAAARATLIHQSGDPTHVVRVTDGYYKRTDDTIGYWTEITGDPFNRTWADMSFIMEEAGSLGAGPTPVFFFMLYDGVQAKWVPTWDLGWPGGAGAVIFPDAQTYAPLATATVDLGPGYNGSNATVPCPVSGITDARLSL